MARPKMDDKYRRKVQIGCRLTEAEMADVTRALKLIKMPLGTWVRETIVGAARRRLRSEGRK